MNGLAQGFYYPGISWVGGYTGGVIPVSQVSAQSKNKIEGTWERMKSAGVNVPYETVWGLWDLYEWLHNEKGIPAHTVGKAEEMFWALLEWSGKDRLTVAAFLNALRIEDLNLYVRPDEGMTMGERVQEGIRGIMEAPGRLLEMAVGPVSDETRRLAGNFAIIAIAGLGVYTVSKLSGGK